MAPSYEVALIRRSAGACRGPITRRGPSYGTMGGAPTTSGDFARRALVPLRRPARGQVAWPARGRWNEPHCEERLTMRILQAPERIKEAPAQALRAVFAGVGQVLLVTERIRRRTFEYVTTAPVPPVGLRTRDATRRHDAGRNGTAPVATMAPATKTEPTARQAPAATP